MRRVRKHNLTFLSVAKQLSVFVFESVRNLSSGIFDLLEGGYANMAAIDTDIDWDKLSVGSNESFFGKSREAWVN